MNFKQQFHEWFYSSEVWKETSYAKVPCQKCPFDLWNYQEIIFEYDIGLVIEFGILNGGSTKYFSDIMRSVSDSYRVVGFDINLDNLHPEVKELNNVEIYKQDTASECLQDILLDIKSRFNFPTLFLLDSDHTKSHVFNELKNVKAVLKKEDYVVVEDTNLNGYPVQRSFGEGPMEAVKEFLSEYPNTLEIDNSRNFKFGLSFAPEGYLIPV